MGDQGIQETLERVGGKLSLLLDPPELVLTDLSGKVGTTAIEAAPAGDRQYIKLQNVTTEPDNPEAYSQYLIGYSFTGAAEIGAPGTFTLGPGDETELVMNNTRPPSTALSVVGSTNGPDGQGLPYTLNVA